MTDKLKKNNLSPNNKLKHYAKSRIKKNSLKIEDQQLDLTEFCTVLQYLSKDLDIKHN